MNQTEAPVTNREIAYSTLAWGLTILLTVVLAK